jgi:hypothetical protein
MRANPPVLRAPLPRGDSSIFGSTDVGGNSSFLGDKQFKACFGRLIKSGGAGADGRGSVEGKNRTIKTFITERVLKLVYTAYDMKPFAESLGYSGEPFVWDEEERFNIKCQLDALFFILYGLNKTDLQSVMGKFVITKKKDTEKYGKYRTKEMILNYYKAYMAKDFGVDFLNENGLET